MVGDVWEDEAVTNRRARPSTTLASFDEPLDAPTQRSAAGKALRADTPRTSHQQWTPPPDRVDPVERLIESNRTRLQDLVPLRYARMAASPLAFLRGSALVMAHDLATTPVSGLQVRLCGDAHIANFGVFASPERRLVFDLNDFDEAAPGPFEWDVKRLAASVEVAARENGLGATRARRTVLGAVGAYVHWMATYAEMTHLEVWYAKLDVTDLMNLVQPSNAVRRRTEAGIRKAEGKNHLKALDKLTVEIDGRRRFIDDPPIVQRLDNPELRERLEHLLDGYRSSLTADRQALFDRYRFVDFARKVVGVGSVGTRCWMVLFQGPNGGPLFLQLKEAGAAAPQVALGTPTRQHHGQRVVEGQRMLQAAGDVLLGWGTDPTTGIHYFVRQLWDAKGSIDVATMRPDGFAHYAQLCGRALARAHARTGDSVTISGYLGESDRFAEAIAIFASAYADQTERDHAGLLAAIAAGSIASV